MTFEARDSAAKVVPATTANVVEDTVNLQKVIMSEKMGYFIGLYIKYVSGLFHLLRYKIFVWL